MSETQRGFFEKHGVPRDRIHVVLHGVDTKFFQPPVCRAESKRLEVLSVGNYRRNFPLLREVCAALKSDPAIHFTIIGASRLGSLFSGLSNVTFRSGLDDRELLLAYQNASCFLLTVEASTANNALLEAMACGLPVVAETIGGIREYVGNDCAMLASPNSAAMLIESLTALAHGADHRLLLGKNARRRAESLDWERVAQRTSEVYRLLCPNVRKSQ
jgi:glycosyltransferase involved in cell wall biosynthesis